MEGLYEPEILVSLMGYLISAVGGGVLAGAVYSAVFKIKVRPDQSS